MDIKDLEKLMKLARKYGLSEVKTPDIEFKVDLAHGPKPTTKRSTQLEPFGVSENEVIDLPDAPTYEDMLFYSATGQNPPEPQ